MAKGLRSKSKRKVKAIRRIENAPLIRNTLLKTLSIDATKLKVPYVTSKSVNDAQAFLDTDEKHTTEDTVMESISEETKTPSNHQVYKNLKNKDGNYPIWMNQRAIKKMKKKSKR